MSILEDKIKRESAFFDTHEPAPGHRERFIDLLDAEPGLKKTGSVGSIWMKMAAMIIVLISVGYVTYNFITEKKSHAQNVMLIEYDEDFESILTYYDVKATDKMQEIESLSPDVEQATRVKNTVLKQFENIDISMAAIEKDYQKNPDNEKLKAAMINSKRNKVKVMEQVIQQLNMAKHQLF